MNLLSRAARCAEFVKDAHTGESFLPYIGNGTGGSSSLYGMVLERRLPHDFREWPIGYDDLAPWYEKAERLFEVSGSRDPLGADSQTLRQPPPLSPTNESLFGHLQRRGLHPYRLHLASRRHPDCLLCQGCLCPSAGCKRDAHTACLVPALAKGDSQLVTNAKVSHLEASNRCVTAVHASVNGTPMTFHGKVVALAAGALSTPRILLASDNMANSSGLVGCRLMRHAIDLFVLTLSARYRHAGESKELAMNDFYAGAGSLGTVQAFGMAPSLRYLRNQPGRNIWKMLGPAGIPISKLFAGAPIVASILEDGPYPQNHVAIAGNTVRLAYRVQPDDLGRRSKLRRKTMGALAALGPIPVFGTSDRKALGHVCGTAVFGTDANTSVLDKNNRAHSLDNLYVVDGSFFPTSGGVNPALTIAANALRVAKHLEEVM